MKNSVIVIASPLLLLGCFLLGCQSTYNSQWLTPSKGGEGLFLGQAPLGDPFAQARNSAPATPLPSLDPFANPFAPIQQSAIGSDQAAEETDLERLRAKATAPRPGTPPHLQPFNHWYGPFTSRDRGRTLEQDIIRQVGFEPVAARVPSNEYEFDWGMEEPKKGFDWSVLDPVKFFGRMREWMGLGPNEEKANESMRKGREILLSNPDLQDRKKNLEAAKHFTDAAKRFPNSVLEEDALHLAGECFFFADNYYDAFKAYQQLVIKYQHSKHVDNAVRRLFQIGRFWEHESDRTLSSINFSFTDRMRPRFDTFGFAKKAYETIFTYDPLGPVSDVALMTLATAYLKRGRHQGDENFNQAAFYYQRLREEHPTSQYVARAHLNELYARMKAYLGPEHPSGTLLEARKLAEMTLWQFRDELNSEDTTTVLEMKESLLIKEAERLWSMGQYFDQRKLHYGSARIYYRRLIEEYPQTEFAERARKRLQLIEGLPDVPPILGRPINPFKAGE